MTAAQPEYGSREEICRMLGLHTFSPGTRSRRWKRLEAAGLTATIVGTYNFKEARKAAQDPIGNRE